MFEAACPLGLCMLVLVHDGGGSIANWLAIVVVDVAVAVIVVIVVVAVAVVRPDLAAEQWRPLNESNVHTQNTGQWARVV